MEGETTDCGLYCVDASEECPIVYFGVGTSSSSFNQLVSEIGSDNGAEYVKKDIKMFTGVKENSGKYTEKVDVFYIKANAFTSEVIKQNEDYKYIFDFLPINDIRIGESAICDSYMNSRQLTNDFPLNVKKICPEDPRYSRVSIDGVENNDFITTASILAYNDGARYMFKLDGSFSSNFDSEWYLYTGSSIDKDLFACIVSWSNGNKFSKSVKSDLLLDNISFFTRLTKDYSTITVIVEVTFALTIIVAILLTIFGFLFVIGQIFCGMEVLPLISKICTIKFSSFESVINWVDFLGEILLLILSIYSYITLKKTSNSVETAISTNCFQGFTLSELNYFSKVLDDFLDSGLQSILIFSSRIALFLVLFLTRILGLIIFNWKMKKQKKERKTESKKQAQKEEDEEAGKGERKKTEGLVQREVKKAGGSKTGSGAGGNNEGKNETEELKRKKEAGMDSPVENSP